MGRFAAETDGGPIQVMTSYICPMLPDVGEDQPGTCPDCGMAFEPMEPAAKAPASPELAAMSLRPVSVIGTTLGLNRAKL